jgi:hypothetical protein
MSAPRLKSDLGGRAGTQDTSYILEVLGGKAYTANTKKVFSSPKVIPDGILCRESL